MTLTVANGLSVLAGATVLGGNLSATSSGTTATFASTTITGVSGTPALSVSSGQTVLGEKLTVSTGSVELGTNVGIACSTGTGSFDFSLSSGALKTPTGTTLLSGPVLLGPSQTFSASAGASLDFSASSAGFKTTTGTTTLSGDVSLAAGKSITASAGTGGLDFSLCSGAFKTTTGTTTLSGNVALAAGKSITAAAGAGGLDFSLCSGTFKTPTGTTTLNGPVLLGAGQTFSASAGAGLDFSGSSAAFKTTTGTLTINGPITVPLSVNSYDFSSSAGTFKTPLGANTISGPMTVLSNLTGSLGSAFDFSASDKVFKTSTGVVSLNGSVSLATGVDVTAAGGNSNIDFSASNGVFKTPTGLATVSGNLSVAGDVAVSGTITANGLNISPVAYFEPFANYASALKTIPADVAVEQFNFGKGFKAQSNAVTIQMGVRGQISGSGDDYVYASLAIFTSSTGNTAFAISGLYTFSCTHPISSTMDYCGIVCDTFTVSKGTTYYIGLNVSRSTNDEAYIRLLGGWASHLNTTTSSLLL